MSAPYRTGPSPDPDWLAAAVQRLVEGAAALEADGPRSWRGVHPVTGAQLAASAESLGGVLTLRVSPAGEPPPTPAPAAPSLDVLAGSLDVLEAARRLARLVVPEFADWATVTVFGEDGTPDRTALAHRDPALEPAVGRYLRQRVSAPRDLASVTVALRSGEPVQLSRISAAYGPQSQSDPAVRAAWAVLAPTSVLFVPLQARGTAFGVLSLINSGARAAHRPAEIDAAAQLVRRASLAVDNARLYDRQLQVAETLQHGLLTPPPQPAGLDIAVRYRPASSHALVGGDWYDAFEQSDGAVLLVIGDVVGHNVQAAAAMAQLRSAVRTLGYDRPDSPGGILDRVDRVLTGLAVGTLATALVARLEHPAPDGSRVLRWSSAGHLPPLVIGPDGRSCLLDRPAQRLLGLDEPVDRVDHEERVHAGDTVLLFTDGLVEAGRVGIDEGLARLTAAVDELGGLAPDALCDRLLTRLVPDRAEDDVALLAVRIGAPVPA